MKYARRMLIGKQITFEEVEKLTSIAKVSLIKKFQFEGPNKDNWNTKSQGRHKHFCIKFTLRNTDFSSILEELRSRSIYSPRQKFGGWTLVSFKAREKTFGINKLVVNFTLYKGGTHQELLTIESVYTLGQWASVLKSV